MKNKVIILDTETTGLNTAVDEILELSIINVVGETLMYEYYKPVKCTSWPGAEAVHHISPEDVKDKYPILNEKDKIESIINNAHKIIGYNVNYDLSMIKAAGIHVNDDIEVIDLMPLFAEIYGEWNDYFQSYKYKSLSVCADYYGYTWIGKAHCSLSDCLATLFVAKKIFGGLYNGYLS